MAPKKLFTNFRSASEYAKAVALHERITIKIQKEGTYWAIVPPSEKSLWQEIQEAQQDLSNDKNDESEEAGDFYEDSETEIEHTLLSDEIINDQDSWERSTEDGWYYDDD